MQYTMVDLVAFEAPWQPTGRGEATGIAGRYADAATGSGA
jgi:hypothetical protein